MSRREVLKRGAGVGWLRVAGLLGFFDGWSFHGTWDIMIAFLIHQFRQ
jgi:hypothetical protein